MQTLGKLGVAVIVLLFIAACSPAAPTAAPAAATKPPAAATSAPAGQPTPAAKIKRGGILLHSPGATDTNSWYPIYQATGEAPLQLPVFETLIRWDNTSTDPKTEKWEMKPELADSWEVVNPTTIRFKLHKGVKFQDGSDFNAEVVKWNFDQAKNDPKSGGKNNAAMMKDMTIIDPYTVQLNLPAPSALAIVNWTRSVGGSGSLWSLMTSKANFEKNGAEYVGSHPIGTGPMMLTDWKPGDRMTFKKWDGYWKMGADGKPLPYIDGIDSRVIPDPAVTLTEMRTGNIQISASLFPQNYASARADPNLTLIVINNSPIRYIFGFNQDKPPFKDNVKLRQALQYAIDRESIGKTLGFGEYTVNKYGLWLDNWLGVDQSTPYYSYDKAKAAQLVKDAGYPNGLDVTIDVPVGGVIQKQAEIVQQMWHEIGVRATINANEEVAGRAKQKAGDFQAAIWNMWPSLDPAHYGRMLYCDGAANWSNYCNKNLEAAMTEGVSSYDDAQRAAGYKKALKIIYDDALIGGIYNSPFNLTYRKELKGVRLQVFAMDLQEVWIDK
ncbi:MAG: ABC transporter substrate-binding protein [Bacteroidetes bacterium]|nr:ABC transporter substrate-binding protein [Bacteroidota bacterium]MCL5027342.1 ABC transporter substrate-binding protein [Chloroflexota bacterium]